MFRLEAACCLCLASTSAQSEKRFLVAMKRLAASALRAPPKQKKRPECKSPSCTKPAQTEARKRPAGYSLQCLSKKRKTGNTRPQTNMKRPAGSNLQTLPKKIKTRRKHPCKTPACKKDAQFAKRFEGYCRPCHKLYGTSINYCRAYRCWLPARTNLTLDGYC